MRQISLVSISQYQYEVLSRIITDWKNGLWTISEQSGSYFVDSQMGICATLLNDEIDAHIDNEHAWLIIRDIYDDEKIDLLKYDSDESKVLGPTCIKWADELYLVVD